MTGLKLLFLFAILFIFNQKLTFADSPCGDWEQYKDEKCFKVLEKAGLQPHEAATKLCLAEKANLISIHSLEEQQFLNNYIFSKSKIVDNIWLGAKFNDSKFRWSDNSEFTFTNWAPGNPKKHANYCVQMHSDSESIGKWVDELCLKKNAVACQKTPTVTMALLMEMVLELKQNPVPIGFIYTQLPSQKAPMEIWPWMLWEDISSAYEGLFFRVLGGNSESFGTKQEADTVRLEGFYWDTQGTSFGSRRPVNYIPIPLSGNSSYINQLEMTSLQFKSHSPPNGDIRPKNTAIRIWKRTK